MVPTLYPSLLIFEKRELHFQRSCLFQKAKPQQRVCQHSHIQWSSRERHWWPMAETRVRAPAGLALWHRAENLQVRIGAVGLLDRFQQLGSGQLTSMQQSLVAIAVQLASKVHPHYTHLDRQVRELLLVLVCIVQLFYRQEPLEHICNNSLHQESFPKHKSGENSLCTTKRYSLTGCTFQSLVARLPNWFPLLHRTPHYLSPSNRRSGSLAVGQLVDLEHMGDEEIEGGGPQRQQPKHVYLHALREQYRVCS